MKKYLLISILISFIVSGCIGRESLFDKASVDPSDVPKIIAYDPHEALTEIPQNTMISVLFSLPMDRTSVEEAFRFGYDGQEYHYSNVDWSHDDRLFSVGPLPSIPIRTMVTVTIHYSAQSKEGIQLEETHEWVFEVSREAYTGNVPIPSVWSPLSGEVIFIDTPISITFDREMLRSSVEASFSLFSDDSSDYRSVDDGTITWTDKTMTFQPSEPLYYDNYYTMSLNDPGVICRDLSGNELAGFQSEFFTIDNAIYVSQPPIGSDSNPGYHKSIPVATIQIGIAKALDNDFTHLKIAEGAYTEDIILDNAIYSNFHFQAGWNLDFTDFDVDPSSYIAEVSPGSNYFPFTLYDVSGVIIDGLKINGGNAVGQNNGAVLINSGSSEITIQNCSIEGGSAGTTHGILIGSGAQNIIIQNNYSISGGATSNSPAFGIYISDNVSATIQDNDIINGGQTSSSDTYGIRVETGANVDIYRNTIIGGEENSTSTYNNYGIYLNSSGLCNIFNNFIVGGTDSTDPSNSCYGIYINNSDINIINNTINGNGQGGGFNRTSAIRADGTSLSYVVNNILIGGEGFAKYGIELSDTSYLFNNMVIYNNTFYSEKCSTAYLGSLTMFWNTILLMETNYNIVPNKPQNNIDYDELPAPTDVEFVSASDPDYDYSIDPISPDLSSIRDNGYPLGNLSIFSTGVPNDAELDRFRNDRDLSTIDRGAHEFNP